MKKTITSVVALFAALVSLNSFADTAAVSVEDVKPIYPKSALERKLTGWVVVEYTVNDEGRAENIVVTDSEPAKVFDGAAKRAIRQTQFLVDDTAQLTDRSRKFVFEIDEEVPGTLAAR